ncbi:MAG: TIGR02530 family flagellar biosynthesis protein [Bacteriovoracales bacterium]
MVNQKINRLTVIEAPKKQEEKNNPEELPKESDFKEIFDSKLKDLKISGHAAKRLKERNLEMDPVEYLKLKEAVSQLKKKGGNDSLVITGKAAYIIDVKNKTIVTAMDKENMENNVFTKIDSTMVIN